MTRCSVCMLALSPLTRDKALEITRAAENYECALTLECGNAVLNAKSMIGLLSLHLPPNGVVTLIADGPDEDRALAEMASLLSGG